MKKQNKMNIMMFIIDDVIRLFIRIVWCDTTSYCIQCCKKPPANVAERRFLISVVLEACVAISLYKYVNSLELESCYKQRVLDYRTSTCTCMGGRYL